MVKVQSDCGAGPLHHSHRLLPPQVGEADVSAMGKEQGKAAALSPAAGKILGVGPVARQAGAVETTQRVGAMLRAGPRDQTLVNICTQNRRNNLKNKTSLDRKKLLSTGTGSSAAEPKLFERNRFQQILLLQYLILNK